MCPCCISRKQPGRARPGCLNYSEPQLWHLEKQGRAVTCCSLMLVYHPSFHVYLLIQGQEAVAASSPRSSRLLPVISGQMRCTTLQCVLVLPGSSKLLDMSRRPEASLSGDPEGLLQSPPWFQSLSFSIQPECYLILSVNTPHRWESEHRWRVHLQSRTFQCYRHITADVSPNPSPTTHPLTLTPDHPEVHALLYMRQHPGSIPLDAGGDADSPPSCSSINIKVQSWYNLSTSNTHSLSHTVQYNSDPTQL